MRDLPKSSYALSWFDYRTFSFEEEDLIKGTLILPFGVVFQGVVSSMGTLMKNHITRPCSLSERAIAHKRKCNGLDRHLGTKRKIGRDSDRVDQIRNKDRLRDVSSSVPKLTLL
ncbi:hypothetical protein ARMGADRAFT_89896 [Armillaria gallica]|uniref:Uncharacterized protein n=1 Tax=Armillaria gallica TaxID=47427 RepID=A0A2H3DGA3_ARMGA|nr:hypothetical protein ARMGADRAFT_89896 [Armillaria gallica]